MEVLQEKYTAEKAVWQQKKAEEEAATKQQQLQQEQEQKGGLMMTGGEEGESHQHMVCLCSTGSSSRIIETNQTTPVAPLK